jgi:hypothetical protein
VLVKGDIIGAVVQDDGKAFELEFVTRSGDTLGVRKGIYWEMSC